MTNSDDTIWLVRSRHSPWIGGISYALGILQVLGGLALLVTPVLSDEVPSILGALTLFLSGGLFLQAGNLLAARKGGLSWSKAQAVYRLVGTSDRDVIEIPAARVVGIWLRSRSETWGRSAQAVEVHAAELVLDDGPTVLVHELPDLGEIRLVVQEICRLTGLAELEPEDGPARAVASTPFSDIPGCMVQGDELLFRFGWSGPLIRPLLTAGVLFLVVGGVLMSVVDRAPVFGFLFGPTLGAMGLCLFCLGLVRALKTESLVLGPERWRHQVRLGGRTLFSQELETAEAPPRIRLVTRGGQGFCLQAIAGQRILAFLGGVAPGTRFSSRNLAAFAGRLVTGERE